MPRVVAIRSCVNRFSDAAPRTRSAIAVRLSLILSTVDAMPDSVYGIPTIRNTDTLNLFGIPNWVHDMLHRLAGIPYDHGMAESNVTPLRSETDPLRTARASFVHGALKDERWSIRQAALAMGVSHSVLSTRLKAETAFLAEELEQIAGLLKRDPVDFYRDYLAVGPEGLEPPASSVKSGVVIAGPWGLADLGERLA